MRLMRSFGRRGPLHSRACVFCFSIMIGCWITPSVRAAATATNMVPIPVTGWNRDLVIESSAVGPPFTNYASEMTAGDGKAFYQTGLPTYGYGLPPSGMFVSMVGDSTIFQLQAYTSNNALVLSADTGLTSGTLTLVTPATYARIAVIAHSGYGTNLTGPLTLNFQDGTTFSTWYLAPDWFNQTTNVAWFGTARVNLTSGADEGALLNPRWHQTTINLATLLGATNKPLASITFGKPQASSTAIYAVSGLLAATNSGPIPVSGWNRDLVIENTASGPPYTAYASEFNPGEGTAFYQNGLGAYTHGLPASGVFSSAVDGTVFQFQPYTGNNALVMSSDTAITRGTLLLSTPAAYNSVSVIANSASGGGTPNLTFNFSDSSTYVTNYNAQDWFSNSVNALNGTERINLSSGAVSGAPDNPKFFQTTIDLVAFFGATNKTLSSLAFDNAAGAGATAVYAVSGVQAAQIGTYTLATVTNLPAAGIGTRLATVSGAVLSAGGDAPEIVLYYGPTDSGTNAANWAKWIWLGSQGGTFAQNLTGLTPNTTYYYACAAVNAAGTSWGVPSQSFTTMAAW